MTPLLRVDGARVRFRPLWGSGWVTAVNNVSFQIAPGECLGLVGESGSGKTTLASAVTGLVEMEAGSVAFRGEAVNTRNPGLPFRRHVQMIFQDPLGALNPRMRVGDAIAEVLRVHRMAADEGARRRRVDELLAAVGLDPAVRGRHPHEISGGQRQRVVIARALATEPALLIADEPVSALDVSIQAQILNLLKDIQEQFNMALLFISHDLATVRYMCSRVIVLYRGEVVEEGATGSILDAPTHPYTRQLIAAVPDLDARLRADPAGTRP